MFFFASTVLSFDFWVLWPMVYLLWVLFTFLINQACLHFCVKIRILLKLCNNNFSFHLQFGAEVEFYKVWNCRDFCHDATQKGKSKLTDHVEWLAVEQRLFCLLLGREQIFIGTISAIGVQVLQSGSENLMQMWGSKLQRLNLISSSFKAFLSILNVTFTFLWCWELWKKHV